MQIGEGENHDSRFKMIKMWKLKATPDYDRCPTFKEGLHIAKRKRSRFPIVYVKWLEEKDRFDGREFNRIESCRGMFEYPEFQEVSCLYFLSIDQRGSSPITSIFHKIKIKALCNLVVDFATPCSLGPGSPLLLFA